MAIDFPNTPSTGDTFTSGGTTWRYDGTKWAISPLFTTDATTTSKGIVQLAGDLSGTAASPQIAANAVGTTEIADDAVTAAKWNVSFGSVFINQMYNAQGNITATANLLYFSGIYVLTKTVLAGVYYTVAGTSNGNVRSALYNASGTRVANRTTNSAQATALNGHAVAFDATYTAAPGLYFAALIFSSNTATAIGANHFLTNSAAQGSFATPSTVTPPTHTTFDSTPRMMLYA